tara:strand:- start:273 stop:665 length:393 start_codon:yes stop_codon:yes gene_type:complete
MSIKRDLVKYVRDKAKSGYDKDDKCYISGEVEDLEFHHYYGLTSLLNKWLRKNKLKINTADEIIAVREDFIEEHKNELYHEVVTLTKEWHTKLHDFFGKDPGIGTVKSQKKWVEKQREKCSENTSLQEKN